MASGKGVVSSAGKGVSSAAGKLIVSADEGGGCPEFDPDLQSSTYSISGYSDGMFTTCSDCTCITCDGPRWDGTFSTGTTGPMELTDGSDGGDAIYTMGSDDVDVIASLSYVFPSGGFCWILGISCPGDSGYIWFGRKDSGSSFAGVYTRVSGCHSGGSASPATVTIV